ncbi:unnamed protein product, partial [marine sediment metagenome]
MHSGISIKAGKLVKVNPTQVARKQKAGLKETKKKNIYLKKKDKSIFEKKRFFFPVKYVYLTSFILVIFIGLLWINNSLKKAQDFPIPSPEIETEATLTLPEENVETKTETLIEETLSSENALIS